MAGGERKIAMAQPTPGKIISSQLVVGYQTRYSRHSSGGYYYYYPQICYQYSYHATPYVNCSYDSGINAFTAQQSANIVKSYRPQQTVMLYVNPFWPQESFIHPNHEVPPLWLPLTIVCILAGFIILGEFSHSNGLSQWFTYKPGHSQSKPNRALVTILSIIGIIISILVCWEKRVETQKMWRTLQRLHIPMSQIQFR